MLEYLEQLDRKILLFVNGHHNAFFDGFMYWCSGQYSWLPFYVLLLLLIILKLKKKAIPFVLLVAVLLTISDQMASSVFKPIFHRFRPSHEPGLEYLLHYVNNYRGGMYGFVSSHAANTFSLAFYFFFSIKKQMPKLTLILFLWAALVSYSRVYLGVHYPSDVVVPIFIAVANGFIISRLYLWIEKRYFTTTPMV
ncbi:MAG: phosphatase PAP2 family protein [Sphingobacteriales bacterium]|uniref:phosphatase PAP2 family protein n=1 Tax=Hydrotalea flava TaxID=714549 RepID=UPI00083254CF|nr:phosphatase PAP2 family protein [Hydrotalea flava]RTL53222.1 MAG: phosphatase PAP2 family protein [Sphingobacteriales bacterium]